MARPRSGSPRELRRQGLTPVYVGVEQKKSLRAQAAVVPAAAGGKDVLYFTQELSTLLNAGVPVDRRSVDHQRADRAAAFRSIVQDVIRVLKGGKSLADSLATQPDYFSELYINMVRAGEASGRWRRCSNGWRSSSGRATILRNYIISSMVYPALLAIVGTASVILLLTFVVPRFAQVFQDSHMKIPLPTKIMLESSNVVKNYGWMAAIGACRDGDCRLSGYIRTVGGADVVGYVPAEDSRAGDALRKAEVARFARAMAYAGVEQRSAGAIDRDRAALR